MGGRGSGAEICDQFCELCIEAADGTGESDEAGCHEAEGSGFRDWAGGGGDGDVIEECADVVVSAREAVVDELELGRSAGDGEELIVDDAAGEVSAGEEEGLGVVADVHGGGSGFATLGTDEVEAEVVGSGSEVDGGNEIAFRIAAGSTEIDAVSGLGAGAEITEG